MCAWTQCKLRKISYRARGQQGVTFFHVSAPFPAEVMAKAPGLDVSCTPRQCVLHSSGGHRGAQKTLPCQEWVGFSLQGAHDGCRSVSLFPQKFTKIICECIFSC